VLGSVSVTETSLGSFTDQFVVSAESVVSVSGSTLWSCQGGWLSLDYDFFTGSSWLTVARTLYPLVARRQGEVTASLAFISQFL
jgi:hypothetical protein